MKMYKRNLPTLCAAGILLAACAQPIAPHYLANPDGTAASVLLPDGHSSESWLVGGTQADPNGVSEQAITEGVWTYYDHGQVKSVPHDLRTDVAPSLGNVIAGDTIPAAIGGAAGIAGARVLGESIKPSTIVNSATATAPTMVNASAAASATARATQTQSQQQQQFQKVDLHHHHEPPPPTLQ